MVAVIAPDAGEAVFQVATVQELVHDLGDDRAKEAVAGLKMCLVAGAKGVEMPRQALPERRCLWFPRSVGLHSTGVYATRTLNLTLVPRPAPELCAGVRGCARVLCETSKLPLAMPPIPAAESGRRIRSDTPRTRLSTTLS